MMSIGTPTAPADYSIDDLVRLVASGELALPQFQRDYVWKPDRVVELIATILLEWPAGSLLLQEVVDGDSVFAMRPFDGGPSIRASHVRLIVLDGQQRITSIFQALSTETDPEYYIDIQGLPLSPTLDELQDRIGWTTRSAFPELVASGSGQLLVPISVLRSPTAFFDWRSSLRPSTQTSDLVARAYESVLRRMTQYRFPAVHIRRDVRAEAIARIFERVNRQGMDLKTFDLMVARTFQDGWNLRDEWDKAKERFGEIEDFLGDDGMPVLRAISMLYGPGSGLRESEVLECDPDEIRAHFSAAVEALEHAITMLRGFGVERADMIPYPVMLVFLIALGMRERLDLHTDPIRAWFFNRSMSAHYAVAANTKAVTDFRQVVAALEAGNSPRMENIDFDAMKELTRRASSGFWRAFVALMKFNSPKPIGATEVSPGKVVGVTHRDRSEGSHLRTLTNVVVKAADARKIRHAGIRGFYDYLDGEEVGAIERTASLLPETLAEISDDEGFIDARIEMTARVLQDMGAVPTES